MSDTMSKFLADLNKVFLRRGLSEAEANFQTDLVMCILAIENKLARRGEYRPARADEVVAMVSRIH